MKRILGIFVLILAVGLLVPGLSVAGDIPDGADCTAGTSDGVWTGSESDRGAVCVGGGAFYIGGEASAEGSGGQPCGAIIVDGTTVAGTADWDNDNGTPNNTADDNHCD